MPTNVQSSSTMTGLNFKFNKPKPAAVRPPPEATSKPPFDDEDDEDNASTQPAKTTKQAQAIASMNKDLRSYTSLSAETAARMAKEALEIDPSGTYYL